MTDMASPPVIAPTSTATYTHATPALGHSGVTISRYYLTYGFAALFPLTAGLMMFGWRALLTVGIILASATIATLVWCQIDLRGRQLRYPHVLWLALALSLMMPAHLASHLNFDDIAVTWAILPLAGVLLVVFCWLLGGLGSGRIHPVVVTYLLLVVLYGSVSSGSLSPLVPRQVLQRNAVVVGDLANSARPAIATVAQDAWLKRPILPDHDSIDTLPASKYLSEYTTGQVSPDRVWLSLEGLLRDRLPPLEDLILGAHPGPIGASSAIAVIIGGLFLIYRGLIDFRIPLIIVISALLAFLVLPVPAVITDRPDWRWAVGSVRGIGGAMGLTFANYEILATPLLFTAFFLATAPAVRPMTRRGRVMYALLTGLFAAVFQLYVSASFGSYLAQMSASLLTPTLDKWLAPRPLV
jgi:Na+-translocating ferredoxin:NAD+ oxidoreductase RnfD subunit